MVKKLLLSLIGSLIFIFWIFQSSINNYWAQSFHKPSPFLALNSVHAWTIGATINKQLTDFKTSMINTVNHVGDKFSIGYADTILGNPEAAQAVIEDSAYSQDVAENDINYNLDTDNSVATNDADDPATPDTNSETDGADIGALTTDPHLINHNTTEQEVSPDLAGATSDSEVATVQITNTTPPRFISSDRPIKYTYPENQYVLGHIDGLAGDMDFAKYAFKPQASKIILTPGDQVLIAGDSMQQGIGRHIRAYLSKNFNVFSRDLSKQSTGLISPNNLNWNKVIPQELSRPNNKYKLLIMLLGANDNYGLYDPYSKHGYSFGSSQWLAHYTQRVMSIMYQARIRGVQVIWILPPNVANRQLNYKINTLKQAFVTAGKQYGVTVVSANQALGLTGDKFVPSVIVNNRVRKTRSADGTHFTITGEKLIAAAVEDHIGFMTEAELQAQQLQRQRLANLDLTLSSPAHEFTAEVAPTTAPTTSHKAEPAATMHQHQHAKPHKSHHKPTHSN